MNNTPSRRKAAQAAYGHWCLLLLLPLTTARAQVFLETRYPGAAPASPAVPPSAAQKPAPATHGAAHPYLSVTGAPALGSKPGPGPGTGGVDAASGGAKPKKALSHEPAKDVLLAPKETRVDTTKVESAFGVPPEPMAPQGQTAKPTGTLPPSTATYSPK